MAIATSAQLARALYDNTAESPQELSFRRGDVLRVLQREGAGGLDGWCLCSLHGQQGIVPANRVKLLPAGPAPKPSLCPASPTQPGSSCPTPERGCEEQEVYVIPPPARPCSASGLPARSCSPSSDSIYKVPRGNGMQLTASRDVAEGVDTAQGSRPLDKAFPVDPELLERGLAERKEALSPEEPLVLSTGDLQLLHFYAGQCQSHYSALQAAVAALVASTQANQPPCLFVPHGKRVVVAAHRLVFVGDTLGRLAASAALRAQVGAAGTMLAQTLRATVLAVKGAALGYPSDTAVQEMARCVAELAGQALRFTTLLDGLLP